jgi:hypothetical protein
MWAFQKAHDFACVRYAKEKRSAQGYFTRAVDEEVMGRQSDSHQLGQRDGRTERDTGRDAEIAAELQTERERKEVRHRLSQTATVIVS